MSTHELVIEAVRIVDVRELGRWKSRRALSRLHREVLVPSFAPEELRSRRELLDDVLGRAATSRAYLALDPTGEVVAGLVADYDADLRVGLVAYFAVQPSLRGQGIGSKIEVAFAAAFIGGVDPALVLGEIQDPRVHPVTPDQDPVARVRLYDRLGVQLLDMPYAMPKLHPEDERVPGTLLVTYHVAPDVGTDSVPSDLLRPYLRRYAEQCEGADAAVAEPDLAEMFAHLEGTDRVPLLPLRATLLAAQNADRALMNTESEK